MTTDVDEKLLDAQPPRLDGGCLPPAAVPGSVRSVARPFPGVEIEDRGSEYWVFVERRIRAAMLGNMPPTPDPEGAGIEEHLLQIRTARRHESGACEVLLFVVPDDSLHALNTEVSSAG